MVWNKFGILQIYFKSEFRRQWHFPHEEGAELWGHLKSLCSGQLKPPLWKGQESPFETSFPIIEIMIDVTLRNITNVFGFDALILLMNYIV